MSPENCFRYSPKKPLDITRSIDTEWARLVRLLRGRVPNRTFERGLRKYVAAIVLGHRTLGATSPAIGDRSQETSYGRTHDLLHGDGPPCPRSAGHGGGGINSIVVGRAASSQTLASFPVTLFSTSVREPER